MALQLQYQSKAEILVEPSDIAPNMGWYRQPSEPDSIIQVQYVGLVGPVWVDLPPLTWWRQASEPVRTSPKEWPTAPGRSTTFGTDWTGVLVEPSDIARVDRLLQKPFLLEDVQAVLASLIPRK